MAVTTRPLTKPHPYAMFAVLAPLAIGAPFITEAIPNGWFPTTTLVYCAIYAMFGVGLNIVVGYAGLLDLGYVAFFLFGAYGAAWFMSTFFFHVNENGSPPGFHLWDSDRASLLPGIHVSFWLVVWVGAILAMISGVIIGAPTLRLKSDYLALVTLGFGEILPQVFRNGESIRGFNLSNGTKGIGPMDQIDMGILTHLPFVPDEIGVFDYRSRYYVILVFLGLYTIASLRLRDGRMGRAWLAIREDELAASLMGVPVAKSKLWSYALGAVAGGVAGAFYGASLGTVNVDTFTFLFSIIILCIVVVGGMGNVWGVILGAILIEWLNYTGLAKIGEVTGIDAPKYAFGIFGGILVLMMLYRREGLLPEARAKRSRMTDEALEKVGTDGASA